MKLAKRELFNGLDKRCGAVSLHRHGEGVLDLADDEDAVEGADAVEVSESPEDKLLIMTHVAGIYLEQVVIISGGIEALHHFFKTGNHGCELTAEFLAVMFQTNITEDHDAVAGLDGIYDRDIFLDIAFPLQSFLAFENR